MITSLVNICDGFTHISLEYIISSGGKQEKSRDIQVPVNSIRSSFAYMQRKPVHCSLMMHIFLKNRTFYFAWLQTSMIMPVHEILWGVVNDILIYWSTHNLGMQLFILTLSIGSNKRTETKYCILTIFRSPVGLVKRTQHNFSSRQLVEFSGKERCLIAFLYNWNEFIVCSLLIACSPGRLVVCDSKWFNSQTSAAFGARSR